MAVAAAEVVERVVAEGVEFVAMVITEADAKSEVDAVSETDAMGEVESGPKTVEWEFPGIRIGLHRDHPVKRSLQSVKLEV